MDKKIIALAVAAAAASSTVNAVEIYNQDGHQLNLGGRAEFRGDFFGKADGSKLYGTMDNNSRFRLNIGGETQINDKISGIGFYEAEQGVNSSSDNDAETDFKQRYMYAGFSGEFGAVTFGRQDTAAVQISQMSDVTTHTGIQKTFIDASDEQVNNTFLYTGKAAEDALLFKASFIAGDEDDTSGFGVSGIYTLPVGVGLGLGYSVDGENTNTADNDKGTALIAGVNYTVDAIYVALTYTTGDTGNGNGDFDGLEMSGKYQVSDMITLMGAYQTSEADGDDTSDFIEFTGDYQFASNFNGYITYKLNFLDNQDEDSMRVGLKYQF